MELALEVELAVAEVLEAAEVLEVAVGVVGVGAEPAVAEADLSPWSAAGAVREAPCSGLEGTRSPRPRRSMWRRLHHILPG